VDARNLPKPVKMALRSKERQSKDTAELLKWIKDSTWRNGRLLGKQPKPHQRLILPVYSNSANHEGD
jgi:hypothetical protein